MRKLLQNKRVLAIAILSVLLFTSTAVLIYALARQGSSTSETGSLAETIDELIGGRNEQDDECIYLGELYDEGENVNSDGRECECTNGSFVCADGSDLESETNTNDTDSNVDNSDSSGGSTAPAEDPSNSEDADSERIEVKLKYWPDDEDYFRIFKITVPQGTKVEYNEGSMSGVKVTLAENAVLSFNISHSAIAGPFSWVEEIDNPYITGLYATRPVGSISPDSFDYSNMVSLTGTCEPDASAAPCGPTSITPGLDAICLLMAGGEDICNDAMATLEIVK